MNCIKGVWHILPRRLSRRKCLIIFSTVIVLLSAYDWIYNHSRDQSIRNRLQRQLRLLGQNNYNNLSSNNESEEAGDIFLNSVAENDQFPFKYIINEHKFCENTKNLYIINVVGVAPDGVEARTRIRKLWGNNFWINKTGFKTIFMVGKADDYNLMTHLRKESELHHDIIQLDFFDTYFNLTLKTLSSLHWLKHYCISPTWVLKSDTDVFINSFELSKFLRKYDERYKNVRQQLVCRGRGRSIPCREKCPHPKWRVTWKEYPRDRYPISCFGPGYIIPRRLVDSLYKAADKTRPYRMEDVYYTGLLPEKLGWTNFIYSIKNYFSWRPHRWSSKFIKHDLMVVELDRWVGRGASAYVWSNILHYRGLNMSHKPPLKKLQ